MKVQLLSLISGVLICTSGYTQSNEAPQEGTLISPEVLNELNHQSVERLTHQSENREDIEGWVSFELTNYNWVYGPDAFYTYGQVISPDSIPKVSFTGGAFRSFTHGFGQMFDPTALDLDITEDQITAVDPYEIDSIGFPSIYRRVPGGGENDSLVLTVVVTDKEQSAGNPYDGSTFWAGGGVLSGYTSIMAPAYEGTTEEGYNYGLTGTTDAGANVTVEKYTFALTEEDTEIFWRSFPVNVYADPDQVVYAYVEYKPEFDAEVGDTAFVFDGAAGTANINSYRTIYDYPVDEEVGYFFDINRTDSFSYNASYVEEVNARYVLNEGDQAWRNDRLSVYSLWGFRFEYYMRATNSASIAEETAAHFQIFPNPTADQFVIQFNEGWNNTENEIRILDLSGNRVFVRSGISENQISLNAEQLGLAAGVYVVSVRSDEQTSVRRLVIR